MKDIKKKIIASIIFICSLFFCANQSLDVSAAQVNEMGSFPSVITLVKDKIVEVSFVKDSQANIDARFNAAPIKADLTSGQGSVKGWLEVSSSDSSKYELYVASEGTISLKTTYQLFKNWSGVKEFHFDNIDTSGATSFFEMFYGCTNLKSLDLSSFNTSNVTYMAYMFYGCKNLESLNVSSFDTSSVTGMSFMFSGCNNLKSLNLINFNTSKVTKMGGMFWGCSNLISLNVSSFNTSSVTDMSNMFAGCRSLTSLALSNFNTSNVTDVSYMFGECNSLTSLNLSNFNTSKVIDMSSMFQYCSSLKSLDLSKFNTQNVTNMHSMFYGCNSLTDLNISGFITNKVTDMVTMFYNCKSLTSLNLSSFNTTNISDMSEMFSGCNSLVSLDISGFDTSKVTDMSSMFSGCNNLKLLDVSKFNTSNVINMTSMFSGCKNLTSLDVSKFNTSKVTNMYGMFSGCNNLKLLDVSNFNTSNVTDMRSMFSSCKNLTSLDVSKFNTSKVTNMYAMFSGCSSLTTLNLNSFDTRNVTDMRCMFEYCSSLKTLNLSNFNTSKITSMFYMFNNCSSLTSLNISNFDTSNVTSMQAAFENCSSLTSLDLSSFNTSKVSNMNLLFSGCKSLKNLDLSNFNTSSATGMNGIFKNCSSLTSLDISSFDTSKVNQFSSMFSNCSNLSSIDVSHFNTGSATTMFSMFENCSNLTSVDVSNFNTSNVTDMRSMFENCSNLTSVDVSDFNTSNVTQVRAMFSGCSKLNLNEIDISKWDTSKMTDLGSIGLPQFDTNTLKTLTLSSGTLNFNPNITTYDISVDSSVANITISSTLTDSNASYVSGYGNRTINLRDGLNTILIKVRSASGKERIYTLNITRAAKSTVNTLKTLTLSEGIINFDPNTTLYKLNVDNSVTSITISSTLTDPKSKYVEGSGNRTVNLNVGLNTIAVRVQSESGSIIAYVLEITRKSNVNTLKTLTLSKGTISFDPNKTNYDLTVDNNVPSITISSTLTDLKSKYVEGFGNRTIYLDEGTNVVQIKVQSENGEVRTYTLNIRRKSSVNTLNALILSSGTISFKPTTMYYDITVNNDVEKINITSTLTDSNSSYVSGFGNREENLNVGLNTILIKVQAENGNISTYTLNVRRKSNVNTLKTLTLSRGTIDFDPNKTDYDLILSNNISSITVYSSLTDLKSKYVEGFRNRTIYLDEGTNVVQIKVQSENGEIRTYTLNITRMSNVNTLKTLTLSAGTINFNSYTMDYNITVNNEVQKITITSTLTDSKSTYVSGYGNREVNLSIGLNTILIKVQSEDGEIRTYTLNITRKSNVNTLKTLALSVGTISFNPNTTSYNIVVNNETNIIKITSTLTDETSKYVDGYGDRQVNLNVGLNTILIKVQAQTGEVRTYTLNITRKSNVNTLKTLTLSTGTINFNSNTLNYDVIVNNEVQKLTITSTLTDSKSTYVDGYGNREVSLKEGLNAILIKVQAESGDVKTYTLNITRKSNVNTLKTLTLSAGIINFDPNIIAYNVIVNNNVDKITISSTLTDSKSTYVSGYGNRQVNLNVGSNVVQIKVKLENGEISTYTLNITRKSNVNTLKTLTLSAGSISFSPNTTNYNVVVNSEVDIIKMTSTLTDSKSKYVEGYGNRQVSLKEGLNTILIKVESENGDVKTYTLNITRKSGVNTLKTLTLSSGTINFNSNVTTYDVVVNNNVDKITISSTLTNSKSTYVSGYGNREVSLKEGLNTILIKVQSEDGSVKTYTLNIRRKSSVNTLKTLTLSSGTINFNSNITTYDVVVNNNVTKITVASTLTDEKSTYVSGYGNGEFNLKEGLNTILIKVQSESGDIKTYTLNISRKSKVNTLKTLTLSSGKINFNPNIIDYNVTVENNVDKIKVTSALTDEKSKYVEGYGNREVNLKEGLNEVLIKVESENGEISTYTLNIIRKNKVDNNDNNVDIKYLAINNYSVNFDSDTTEYTLKIKDEVSLNIEVVLVNNNSTYQILNNNNLENGSIITIEVTSPDKQTVKSYKIHIEKGDVIDLPIDDEEENENSNSVAYVALTILSIGIVSLIGSIIFKKRK